jgi:hypothetical protein
VNVTAPVGVPLLAVTVAVNLTDAPDFEGFNEETIAVVVEARFTVWANTADVLLFDSPSPP